MVYGAVEIRPGDTRPSKELFSHEHVTLLTFQLAGNSAASRLADHVLALIISRGCYVYAVLEVVSIMRCSHTAVLRIEGHLHALVL